MLSLKLDYRIVKYPKNPIGSMMKVLVYLVNHGCLLQRTIAQDPAQGWTMQETSLHVSQRSNQSPSLTLTIPTFSIDEIVTL